MALFTNRPPKRDAAAALTIIRTQARGKSGGIILSPDMYGRLIHFHGRSMPCSETDQCPLCNQNNEPRWTGYLPVWLPTWSRCCLLELPTAAGEQVADWQEQNGSLMHKLIYCTRPKARANSRVKVEIKNYDISGLKLPMLPSVKDALCLIWQIDKHDPDGSIRNRLEALDRYQKQQVENNGNGSPVVL